MDNGAFPFQMVLDSLSSVGVEVNFICDLLNITLHYITVYYITIHYMNYKINKKHQRQHWPWKDHIKSYMCEIVRYKIELMENWTFTF